MKKSQIKSMPPYFDRYINLTNDVDIITALEKNGLNYFLEHRERIKNLGDSVYEDGKWTAKEILQHIIDTERVFTYRAL
ncbi:MAG: DinB family protein, partial [Bacteroidia bacterium]|nr:DinB family protein [Bacteroidia bacterium]